MNLVRCKCGCGKFRTAIDKKGRPREYIQGHQPNAHRFQKGNKLAAANSLEKHHRWKGGRYVRKDGYVRVTLGNSVTNLEHIVVFEKAHGCCMLPWSSVHHKNGTKTDNRVENLEGMMKREHRRMHSIEMYRNCSHNWKPTASKTRTPLVRCSRCGTVNTSLLLS